MIHPITAAMLADVLCEEKRRLAVHRYRTTRSPLRARLAAALGRRSSKPVPTTEREALS
jgi:hypothetical protein